LRVAGWVFLPARRWFRGSRCRAASPPEFCFGGRRRVGARFRPPPPQ
jgi:hypothetical protein